MRHAEDCDLCKPEIGNHELELTDGEEI